MQDLTYIRSYSIEDFKSHNGASAIEVFNGDNGLFFRCGAATGTVSANVTSSSKVKVSRVQNSEREFWLLHLDKSSEPKFTF